MVTTAGCLGNKFSSFKFSKVNRVGIVDHPTNVQITLILINDRYADVVTHEVVSVPRNGGLDKTILGLPIKYSSMRKRTISIVDPKRLSIVRKVKTVYHILCLFLLSQCPSSLWEGSRVSAIELHGIASNARLQFNSRGCDW